MLHMAESNLTSALHIHPVVAGDFEIARQWARASADGATQLRYLTDVCQRGQRFDWWLSQSLAPVGTIGLFRHSVLGDWAVSVFVAPNWRNLRIARIAMSSVGAVFRDADLPLLATVRKTNQASVRSFSEVVTPEPVTLNAADDGKPVLLFRLDQVAVDSPWVCPSLSAQFTTAVLKLLR